MGEEPDRSIEEPERLIEEPERLIEEPERLIEEPERLIEALDAAPEADCLAALAPLFEGAPRFLSRLCAARPFGAWPELFARARAIARSMPEDERIELLDAHPRLGAPPDSVSAASFVEQGYEREAAEAGDVGRLAEAAGAGRAPEAERRRVAAEAERGRVAAELDRLNAAYEARFGFRYCVFVAGRPRAALLPEFERALSAERDAELLRAIEAVLDIAEDRWRTGLGRGGSIRMPRPAHL